MECEIPVEYVDRTGIFKDTLTLVLHDPDQVEGGPVKWFGIIAFGEIHIWIMQASFRAEVRETDIEVQGRKNSKYVLKTSRQQIALAFNKYLGRVYN